MMSSTTTPTCTSKEVDDEPPQQQKLSPHHQNHHHHQQWQTPLYCCCKMDSTPTVVTIPQDGWYAFFFGYDDNDNDSSSSDQHQHRLSVQQRELPLPNYSLTIRSPPPPAVSDTNNNNNIRNNDENDSDGATEIVVEQQHDLPLRHDDRTTYATTHRQKRKPVDSGNDIIADNDALSIEATTTTTYICDSLCIGKLLFLNEACTLTVVTTTMQQQQEQRQQQQHPTTTNDTNKTTTTTTTSTQKSLDCSIINNSNNNNCDTTLSTTTTSCCTTCGGGISTPKWCVVRPTTPTKKATTSSTPSLTTTAVVEAVVSTTSRNPKKSLVCRLCLRSFHTWHAIQNHMFEIHTKKRKNSNQIHPRQQHPQNIQQPHSCNNGNDIDGSIKNCDANDYAASTSISEVQGGFQDDHATANRDSTAPVADELFASDVDNDHHALYDQPLQVVFQDAYMAVVIKPQGMPVMGGKPSLIRSDLLMDLVCTKDEKELIQQQNKNKSTVDDNNATAVDAALGKPRPVHRLDSATGGLLVIAKTRCAEINLRLSFQNRTCHKRYRALVCGKLIMMPDSDSTTTQQQQQAQEHNDNVTISIDYKNGYGVIDSPLSDKESKTLFQVVRHVNTSTYGILTLVDLWPVTGRKHQLRKHMKLIGHPIFGDIRYSGKSRALREEEEEKAEATHTVPSSRCCSTTWIDTKSRLCLWAMEITLPHPTTGENVSFRMSDPKWLDMVIQQEEDLWQAAQQHRTGEDDD